MNSHIVISKKLVWGGLLVFVVIVLNALFLTIYMQEKDPVGNDVDTLFQRSSYTMLANEFNMEDLDDTQLFYVLIAKAKLGQHKEVRQTLQGISVLSTKLEKLYKIYVLFEKKDWQGLLDYAEGLTDEDVQVRAFYLQMRALAYIKQNKLEEGGILARDSVALDSFSPGGLVLDGIVDIREREWADGLEKIDRALALGYTPDDDMYYYQGLSSFYLNRRETMFEYFGKVSSNSEHMYNILLYKGRYYLEQNLYQKAIQEFEKCENIDPTAWTHQMRIGKVYMQQGFFDKAYKFQLLAKERSTGNPHPELLSDMLVTLYKLDRSEEINITEALLQERLGTSQRYHELYITALQKSGLYEKALSVGEKAIETLSTVVDADLESIYNLNLRSIIYKLLETKGTEEEAKRFDKLINYQGATTKERYIYLALRDFGSGETGSALRALQELDPTVTVTDLKTVQILHFIYDGKPKSALKKLSTYSDDHKYNIDYQWLKWKTLSLLQAGAEEYREDTKKQLVLLNQLNGELTTNEAFEQRFDKFLKYMKHFY